jgi:ubiquinone/menaquinone biosynthesis C-methylase UbiE
MLSLPRKILKLFHLEGIPPVGTTFYNLVSGSGIFQKHYELVARDLLNYATGGKILDVGAGPGWLMIKISEIGPDFKIFGVDVSKSMVKKARANLARAGLAEDIEVTAANASAMPFDDESFDAVVSTGSIHHWKDPTSCLNEIYRVLKPGGHALIYDLVSDTPKEALAQTAKDFGNLRMWILWLHAYEEPFYSYRDFPRLAEPTHFKSGEIRFLAAMCCLVLRRGEKTSS